VVREHVRQLLEDAIVKLSASPYVNPMTILQKVSNNREFVLMLERLTVLPYLTENELILCQKYCNVSTGPGTWPALAYCPLLCKFNIRGPTDTSMALFQSAQTGRRVTVIHNYLIQLFQLNNMSVNEQTPLTSTSHMPIETYYRVHTLPSTNATGHS